MSAFKRRQSKVFWGQMESRDFESGLTLGTRLPAPAGPRGARPLTGSTEHEQVYSQLYDISEVEGKQQGMDKVDAAPGEADEENSEIMIESDTSDQENATVIHVVARVSSVNYSVEPAENQSSLEEAAGLEHQEAGALEQRSFSPVSRSQRSQDSGFSDSERSADSSDQSPHSPRRRRRRRSKHRRRAQSRQKQLDKPAHTSTPKLEPRRKDCELKLPRDVITTNLDCSYLHCDRDKKSAGQEEEESSAGMRNSLPETIEDFFYTSDPLPEDNQEPDNRALEWSGCRDVKLYEQTLKRLNSRAPIRLWLEELRTAGAEEECQATLQSKSLVRHCLSSAAKDESKEETERRDVGLITASATTAAKKLIDVAKHFDGNYQRALELIGNKRNSNVQVSEQALAKITAEARDILGKLGSVEALQSQSQAQQARLQAQEKQRHMVMQLVKLKHALDRALDARLDFYIEKVVRGLEEASEISAARGALAGLTALGLAGARAGASVARCNGIRVLLRSSWLELRSASLRALGSVCCCIEALEQFVDESGPEILTDLLTATEADSSLLSEAAALLVQITAPWMDRLGLPYLEPYGSQLVRALTDLAERTNCKQTLLLAAAGINNLSRSTKCIGYIIDCASIKKLLRCIKKSNDGNVWLMEQVASMIGQVARLPQARAHLAETRASVALVCFLRMRPPGLGDEYHRLAATTTEALTRLCVDPELAKQVVAVGGADFLPSRFNGETLPDASTDSPRRLEVHPPRILFSGNNARAGNNTSHSLRLARRIAAEQIGIAKIHDCSNH